MAENKGKPGGEKKKKEKVPKFSTHTGHPLTPNETKFIDEYIQSGNGLQSVVKAGYATKNPRQYSVDLLAKPYIREEINFRLEQARTESIASAEEIMQYFTDVMRGNIKDQFGLEASLGERTKAAQELAKRQIDIPNKANANDAPEIKITLDWARPTTDKTGDDGK